MTWPSRIRKIENLVLPTNLYFLVLALLLGLLLGGGLRILLLPPNLSMPNMSIESPSWKQGHLEKPGSERQSAIRLTHSLNKGNISHE